MSRRTTGRSWAACSAPPGSARRSFISIWHEVSDRRLEITSETTAKGTWYLEDFVISQLPSEGAPDGTVMHGTGIYRDEYVKIDGEWMISHTGYERIFEDFQPRGAGSRLRTRWDKKK